MRAYRGRRAEGSRRFKLDQSVIMDIPAEIRAVAEVLVSLRAPWAVAGGWAIDLALGRVTRRHADVDIAVFRSDQEELRASLSGWHFDIVVEGTILPWASGKLLRLPVHEVHARPLDATAGPALELLLNERDGSDWVYRRDSAIRLPLARAIRHGPGGLLVLAPEVVLLYKSKTPRPTDEQDFRAALPHLDVPARAWLRAALLRASAEHPWAAALRGART
jgi:hypothetical protein